MTKTQYRYGLLNGTQSALSYVCTWAHMPADPAVLIVRRTLERLLIGS